MNWHLLRKIKGIPKTQHKSTEEKLGRHALTIEEVLEPDAGCAGKYPISLLNQLPADSISYSRYSLKLLPVFVIPIPQSTTY